jgi:hypothetical protein
MAARVITWILLVVAPVLFCYDVTLFIITGRFSLLLAAAFAGATWAFLLTMYRRARKIGVR